MLRMDNNQTMKKALQDVPNGRQKRGKATSMEERDV